MWCWIAWLVLFCPWGLSVTGVLLQHHKQLDQQQKLCDDMFKCIHNIDKNLETLIQKYDIGD